MADSMAMMPWFPDSFMGATVGWDLDEVGLYLNLLCSQWTQGGLPSDVAKLPQYGRCTPEAFARAWPKVAPKFRLIDGQLFNARLEQHRAKSLKLRIVRSTAGSAGGKTTSTKRASAGKAKAVAKRVANGPAKGVAPTPTPTPPPSPPPTPLPEAQLSLHGSLPQLEWAQWIALRRKRRWPCDDTTMGKQLAELAKHPTEVQREMIGKSINAGWQGIFPLKPHEAAKVETSRVRLRTTAQMMADEEAENVRQG